MGVELRLGRIKTINVLNIFDLIQSSRDDDNLAVKLIPWEAADGGMYVMLWKQIQNWIILFGEQVKVS